VDNNATDFRVIALIIASALFMENLDATILTTAIPVMARDFAVPAPGMSVTLTAYLVALALFIPASGHVADRWGAKQVLRVAIAIFAGGSLVCAIAPNLTLLVPARFAQGLGGAMMVPVGRLVLLRTVAKRDLIAANSWLVMPGLLGQVCGPPLGGFIVTYFHWRWIFWINLPVGALAFWLVGRFVPDLHEQTHRPSSAGVESRLELANALDDVLKRPRIRRKHRLFHHSGVVGREYLQKRIVRH
jgi:MFS family permease